MRWLLIALLLATPAQASTLTLICTGKTFQRGAEIGMAGTAILDLDKLTFKPPWSQLTYSIHSVDEKEIWFSVHNDVIHGAGTLDRVTGRLHYSIISNDARSPRDVLSSAGVCGQAAVGDGSST